MHKCTYLSRDMDKDAPCLFVINTVDVTAIESLV